jgi:CheY-like chemotaxis protein
MSNLLAKMDLEEEQSSYVSSIKQSSEILLGIINDILEISTLQNGKIQFEYKDFDLPQLMSNLVNVMQYKINEKDLSFELEIDPEVPKVLVGDKLRLNQILYNLVGNAVKFTDKGFVKVRVHNLGQTGDAIKIKFEVEDSGIGIPQDKIDAVFESFTRIRTKERLFEGTGLGLSIAKNLVVQQEGQIGLSSELGKGSIFYFELLFKPGEASRIQEGIAESTPANIKEDLEVNLLLVEDHKMNQLVARKTLERQWEKIKITIANNGKEAIDILKEQTFDIILMDIQMPIMDGYETTQYIRNNMPPEIAKLPILAMTAHAHIAKDEKFKEYGMDDFVLKPFEPNQLFEKITKYTQT